MLNYDISSCCKILRFSRNMVENSEKIEAETHQDYLLKLLRLEIEHREAARRERLIKGAKFHAIKTFESFNFDDVILPSDVTKDYLKECRFLEEKKNLVFYGNISAGKTHLATALGLEACRKGKSVKFFRTAALVNKLSEAKAEKNLSGLMKCQFSH
ncbi:MAG: ATP-binding protein [Anaerovoracaceae bacterium]|jgi:DNA replication protein DnaC